MRLQEREKFKILAVEGGQRTQVHATEIGRRTAKFSRF